MPIPLIVAGVWGAAAYAGCKSQKEAKQKTEEYNSICYQIETETNEIQSLANETYESYRNAISRIDTLKSEVYYGSLTEFVNSFNQIKNKIHLQDDLKALPVICSNFKLDNYSAENNYIKRSAVFASPVLAGGVAVMFGAIGGGLMFLQGKMKTAQINGKIDEANTILSQVMAKGEEVKLRCTQITYNKKQLELYYNTFSQLNVLVINGNKQIQRIISKYGNDYSTYSDKTQANLRSIANLAHLMRDFVKEDIINNNGDIYHSAKERFENCQNLLSENNISITTKASYAKNANNTFNIATVIMDLLIIIGVSWINVLIGILSPLVSFFYARKGRCIIPIILLIINILFYDPLPFVDEIIQIVIAIYGLVKYDREN